LCFFQQVAAADFLVGLLVSKPDCSNMAKRTARDFPCYFEQQMKSFKPVRGKEAVLAVRPAMVCFCISVNNVNNAG